MPLLFNPNFFLQQEALTGDLFSETFFAGEYKSETEQVHPCYINQFGIYFGGENQTSYLSIENLKHSDQGAYRCRVDFKKAPSKIYKLYLEVVGRWRIESYTA